MTLSTLLDQALASGKLFSVTFIKADGSERTMLCRTGVSKGVKGTGKSPATMNPENAGVYEITRGINGRLGDGQFRCFNKTRVVSVKFAKQIATK